MKKNLLCILLSILSVFTFGCQLLEPKLSQSPQIQQSPRNSQESQTSPQPQFSQPSQEENINQTQPITQTTMQKVLIVIAPKDYQDIEYETPKKILQDNGFEVITTSTKEIATGSLGGTTKVDILMNKINPNDYTAIIFVGGPGSHNYFDYQPALDLAKTFYESGKLTTAICAAPSILANAGILEGKTVTAFSAEESNIKSHGGNYTGNLVEQDGNIITGNGPQAAKAFGEKIVNQLKQ